MQIVKHSNTDKLVSCVKGRSNCRQANVKICIIVCVIYKHTVENIRMLLSLEAEMLF